MHRRHSAAERGTHLGMPDLAAKGVLAGQKLCRLGLFLDKRLRCGGAEIGDGGFNLALLADDVGTARRHCKTGKFRHTDFLLMAGAGRDQQSPRLMPSLDKRGKDFDLFGDKRRLLQGNALLGLLLQDRAFQCGDILAQDGYPRRQRLAAGGEQRHLLLDHFGRCGYQRRRKQDLAAALGLRRQAHLGRAGSVQRDFVIGEIGGHILIFEPVEHITLFHNLAKLGFDHHNRTGEPALNELHFRRGEDHPFGTHLLVDLGIDRPGDRNHTEDRDQHIENLPLGAGALRQRFRCGMVDWRAAHGQRRRAKQLVEDPADREQDQP